MDQQPGQHTADETGQQLRLAIPRPAAMTGFEELTKHNDGDG
jgi:hypothetical protein